MTKTTLTLFGEQQEPVKHKYPANGYAARPGTGPAGETCKTCKHSCYHQRVRRFWKCRLMKDKWTHGYGTDIRLKSPACKEWSRNTSSD